jgi:hypothetical protein
MAKNIVFGDQEYPVPPHVNSVEAARGFAALFLPGLQDAEGFVNEDGDFEFRKKAGTKGE